MYSLVMEGTDGVSLLLGRHVVMRQLLVKLKVHVNFMVSFLVNCNVVINLRRSYLCVYREITARDANSYFPFQILTLEIILVNMRPINEILPVSST